MNEQDLIKIEKHSGAVYEFNIGEDLFQMEQLEWNNMPKFLTMFSILQRNLIKHEHEDEEDTYEISLKGISLDEFEIIKGVIEIAVAQSFKSLKDKPELLSKFCMNNFNILLDAVVETNQSTLQHG